MHKCPAPCDGSISMDQYRTMIEWSLPDADRPGSHGVPSRSGACRRRPRSLRFETAARSKRSPRSSSPARQGRVSHMCEVCAISCFSVSSTARDRNGQGVPHYAGPYRGGAGPDRGRRLDRWGKPPATTYCHVWRSGRMIRSMRRGRANRHRVAAPVYREEPAWGLPADGGHRRAIGGQGVARFAKTDARTRAGRGGRGKKSSRFELPIKS